MTRHSPGVLATCAATATLAVMLALAGCAGGPEPDGGTGPGSGSGAASPSPSASRGSDLGAPAAGPEIVGGTYTFRAPEGWRDVTARSRAIQEGVDSAAGATEPEQGFASNVTVGYDDAPGATLETLEASIPGQLSGIVTDLEQLDHVMVAGTEFLHHRGEVSAAGMRYFLEQLTAIDGEGRVTIVSFSFPRRSTAEERAAVVRPVLASWRWTG